MIRPAHSARLAAGFIISAALALFALSGCKKKDSSCDLSPNVNVADDIVFLQRGLFHTFNLLLKANLDSMIMKNGYGTIDQASISYNHTIRKFEIRYNSKTCADSTCRNGIIIVKLSGDFFTPGTFGAVSFQNYSEDYRGFTGKDSLVNQGMAAGGLLSYASFINNLVVTKDSSNSTYWNSGFVYHIPPPVKDLPGNVSAFTISGSGNGISSGTYHFSFQITNSLVNDLSCPWIRQGVMDVSVPDVDITSGTVEYVNRDTCNNRVTYNFDGNVYYWWINLKKLKP